MSSFYLPDLLYADGAFRSGLGLLVAEDGTILAVGAEPASAEVATVRMRGKAMLPGLVNAHSHSFQRLIRGTTERAGPNGDDFWAWRNAMYHAASVLDPEDLFHAARMVFLEMLLSGITAVGEFHYVHRRRDGRPYEDPNLLARTVIEAATSVGIRICLLRVAYARAGYELPPHPGQRRFYESPQEYLRNTELLAREFAAAPPTVTVGVAPHSIRAVTLDSLIEIADFAQQRQLPIHMHVAEQMAEIAACEREYGAPPIRLMAKHDLLSRRMTLIHAIHTNADEVEAVASSAAHICSCPTTERNLGDGIIDAEIAIEQGIRFCFGTDSQATIDLLEDARELDYHLRLKRQRRVLLDGIGGEEMSQRLFRYASAAGADSLALNTGRLEPGKRADFFTVDLDDLSIAGVAPQELLPTIVFSLNRTAIRDVAVDGRFVVTEGRHMDSKAIVNSYKNLARRLENPRSDQLSEPRYFGEAAAKSYIRC